MNIGIIGSGGREHSLCFKLKESKIVDKIYCFPGNAGTEKIAQNINIETTNFEGVSIKGANLTDADFKNANFYLFTK